MEGKLVRRMEDPHPNNVTAEVCVCKDEPNVIISYFKTRRTWNQEFHLTLARTEESPSKKKWIYQGAFSDVNLAVSGRETKTQVSNLDIDLVVHHPLPPDYQNVAGCRRPPDNSDPDIDGLKRPCPACPLTRDAAEPKALGSRRAAPPPPIPGFPDFASR
uniref:Uncharacterized protein n=1 Tax=Oryza punctata TaxID=4537 RepID=A0A0E0K439_ORYPU